MTFLKKAYTFDDVLLVPQYSNIKSRSDVDTSVDFGGIKLKIPILSANMKTVTDIKMIWEMYRLGGMGVLHRFKDIDTQIEEFKRNLKILEHSFENHVAVSIGVSDDEFKRIEKWAEINPSFICIDVAHGHHENVKKTVQFIRKLMPKTYVIAGNVSTYYGAKFLAEECGVDVVKCGQGSGSLCTTRIETGNGVPQLTALILARKGMKGTDCKLIADGGMRTPGDIVKALCFADAVMLGNMLAGCEECPGEIIETKDGRRFKEYVGSSTHKTNHIEGVRGMVPYKGPVRKVIERIMDGIRSGMSYQGCSNLNELKECPEFVEISSAGQIESNHHDVILL